MIPSSPPALLCESPLTFQAIIIRRDELMNAKILLRDIFDLEATYEGPEAKAVPPAAPPIGAPPAAPSAEPAVGAGDGVEDRFEPLPVAQLRLRR
jgi:RNA polymerase primary sigma factor